MLFRSVSSPVDTYSNSSRLYVLTTRCNDTLMCNSHQCVNNESQSLMQIRECEVMPNWLEQLVHEVKVVEMLPYFFQLSKTVTTCVLSEMAFCVLVEPHHLKQVK